MTSGSGPASTGDQLERTDVDLLIVGAGPAGTSAAIRARQRGLSVLIADKAAFPRDKICGDGLTTNALRYLRLLGVDVTSLSSSAAVGSVLLRSPSGREVSLELPSSDGSYAVVTMRRELDNALFQHAVAAGAASLERASIVALSTTSDGVSAEFDARRQDADLARRHIVNARWAIAADGMWSPSRKLLGVNIDGYRGDWHGFRQYLTNVSDRASKELFVSFEADLLPGYFWSFPLSNGQANIGFGVQRPGLGVATKVQRVQSMADIWPDLLARPHIRSFIGENATPIEPHRAWPIPARINGLALHHGRVLFAGDAVGACDPMTGEGIGQALQTGYYAASAVADAVAGTGDATAAYERSLKQSLYADHRMSHTLLRALAHRKGARTAIALVDTNDWTRRNFARWLFEDYPRAALFQPGRWSSIRHRYSGAKNIAPWDSRNQQP